jgi:hypothetical protein
MPLPMEDLENLISLTEIKIIITADPALSMFQSMLLYTNERTRHLQVDTLSNLIQHVTTGKL